LGYWQKTAAADGTQFALYEENLISEPHQVWLVARTTISLIPTLPCSVFITCGGLEAVYIIDAQK